MQEEYEKTGKVRFEFKHFIINGDASAAIANANECAADQGRFWDYHDVVMSRSGTSADALSKPALKQFAVDLGLDTEVFNACVDGNLHLEKVYQDTNEGRSKGVSATPTFFINDQKIEGAVPFEQFKAVIDGYLANTQ